MSGKKLSEENLKIINKTFKGLEFKEIEYSDQYEDYEIHFKGGRYFCIGFEVNVTAEIRQIHINPKFQEELDEDEKYQLERLRTKGLLEEDKDDLPKDKEE